MRLPCYYISFPSKLKGYESLESECYELIQKQGALIRIKGSKLTGKTSLVSRVIHRFQIQNHFESHIVTLNLEEADTKILASSQHFLRWFCLVIGKQLGLKEPSENFWPDFLGNRLNCINYFENYLLSEINCPLVLALDNVDRIFPFEGAHDFFPVLRWFHEKAKTSSVFQKLRIIMVHSTEIYIQLKGKESPFNVGTPIELRDFNREQINALVYRHGLIIKPEEIDDLMTMIGGHPYLIRLAFYHLAESPKQSLNQLLQKAPTEEGIYKDHLRRLLCILRTDSGLENAYKTVISTPLHHWIELDPIQIFILDGLGLVTKKNNAVKSRYLLYSQYFNNIL